LCDGYKSFVAENPTKSLKSVAMKWTPTGIELWEAAAKGRARGAV
jgi:hypothetical protein